LGDSRHQSTFALKRITMDTSTTIEQQTLADQLISIREKFMAGASGDLKQTFTTFIKDLHNSGLEEKALQVGRTAPDFVLRNALDTEVRLSEVLKKGPVILTWYRGGWCPYCNMQLQYLQRALPEFISEGANLIAITPEKLDSSLDTKEKHQLQFEVLTDSANTIARLYAGVHHVPKEVRDHYHDRNVYDNYEGPTEEFPLPATYVIARDFIVKYAFVNPDYRMRAEPSDIIETLRNLTKDQSR
jgi:peroxiredoxin